MMDGVEPEFSELSPYRTTPVAQSVFSVNTISQPIDLARLVAARHGLAPELVCAVCEQESAWQIYAIRPEEGFFHKYIHPANVAKPTTEELLESWSYGLMQVMGKVARERGFKGRYLTELFEPATNLEIGCKHLAVKLAVANGDVHSALQRWNGGGAPNYGAQVMARMAKYSA